ncbi:NADH-quinone oxidoreductase subunit C [Candidatus Bathyarchaeota archaeon]|nr:NADH-quinone oxidoreductase subunit C [Candidatus Bathyarchaeota archaeon]
MTINVNHEDTVKVASSLKEWGFNHLSDVTVVDYLEDEEFEIIYHLWDHNNHERLILKTRIPRDNPVINTLTHIWTSAQMHERENHEMFGVNFNGNNKLTPLLLEDWDGLPPLRKDFDSRQYVLDEFYGGERA